MIGPLSILWLASRLIVYDAWCQPVIHLRGDLPRPAPLYEECIDE